MYRIESRINVCFNGLVTFWSVLLPC